MHILAFSHLLTLQHHWQKCHKHSELACEMAHCNYVTLPSLQLPVLQSQKL